MATKKRQDAMQWWNSMSDIEKQNHLIMNPDHLGGVRIYHTLTGREIEEIYQKEKFKKFMTLGKPLR